LRKVAAAAWWVFTRDGIVSSNIWEAGGLIRSNEHVPYPNIQYHFGPVGVEYEGNKIKLKQAFAIHVDQLRPKSRGYIKLKSSNPNDKPLMYFNYLSNEHDMQEMVEGVHKIRELISQPAFDEFRGAEIEPGAHANTDEEIRHAIRNMTTTDYHPCGTCRMGSDKDAVVDDKFRVRGIKNLRVVDASVMPNIISGNLNAPTQMIAARAADYILGKPQLEPFDARFSFQ